MSRKQPRYSIEETVKVVWFAAITVAVLEIAIMVGKLRDRVDAMTPTAHVEVQSRELEGKR